MPAIDRKRVEHVAGLARIALTEDELERFTGQLQVVLGAIAELADVDTSDVPPSASVLPLENVMREDELRGAARCVSCRARSPRPRSGCAGARCPRSSSPTRSSSARPRIRTTRGS